MQTSQKFELEIVNNLNELRRMSEWLQQTLKNFNIASSFISNFDLCANETVANIISYAYKDDVRHQIYLCIEVKENQTVTLSIQDDGTPFNPFEMQEPTPFDTIENASIGGLGIHFMRNLMDESNYCCANGKNNVNFIANVNPALAQSMHTSMPETQGV